MLLVITSIGDKLLSGINVDDCDEMDGDSLRQPANKNCYRLSRV